MAKHTDRYYSDALAYLGSPAGSPHGAWTPNTDVYETAGGLVVRLELAGVALSDLTITLHERSLVVRGVRRDPCRPGRCSFRQMEIDYGPFERRIVVPRAVDARRAHAHFEDGFLKIELPVAAASEPVAVSVIIEHVG